MIAIPTKSYSALRCVIIPVFKVGVLIIPVYIFKDLRNDKRASSSGSKSQSDVINRLNEDENESGEEDEPFDSSSLLPHPFLSSSYLLHIFFVIISLKFLLFSTLLLVVLKIEIFSNRQVLRGQRSRRTAEITL